MNSWLIPLLSFLVLQDPAEPTLNELAALQFIRERVRPVTYNLQDHGVRQALVTLRIKDSPLGHRFELLWDVESDETWYQIVGLPPEYESDRRELVASLKSQALLAVLPPPGSEDKLFRLAMEEDGPYVKITLWSREGGAKERPDQEPEQVRWYAKDGRLVKLRQHAMTPSGRMEFMVGYDWFEIDGQYLISGMTRALEPVPVAPDVRSIRTQFHYRKSPTSGLHLLDRLSLTIEKVSEVVEQLYLIDVRVNDEIDPALVKHLKALPKPGEGAKPTAPSPEGAARVKERPGGA
ncbi:MAG: hypothetical protein AB1486_01810 [Planctomycetota bacterium]